MRAILAAVAVAGAVAGCADTGARTVEPLGTADAASLTPRLGGDRSVVEAADPDEVRRLGLVATNLVAALVQIPELRPVGTTLQVNAPSSVFGNLLVRALEDAGYGLQLVDADQGLNYVGYSRRVSETEAGRVTDFSVSAGPIELTREYVVDGDAIFPSSLMRVEGVSAGIELDRADEVFAEQGGTARSFVSGTRALEGQGSAPTVDAVDVFDHDALPLDARTSSDALLDEVRLAAARADDEGSAPDLNAFEQYRRTVLVFDDPTTAFLGDANKRAVRFMVRDVAPRDLLVIRACRDFDGRDEAAMARGIRVEEELIGLGVPPEAAWIAPCAGASYRYSNDDSPAPVELVHLRPVGGAAGG